VRELRAVVENAGIVARGGVITRADVDSSLQARGGFASSELGSGTLLATEAVRVAEEPEESGAFVKLPSPAQPRYTRRPGSLPDLQRDVILRAFEESRHNLSRAASELGIPRSTLRARLKRYGAR
jgi:DNA-binding NtrC family response regulator